MSKRSPSKISLFRGIVDCKCPHCRIGNVFPHRKYDLGKFAVTRKVCNFCEYDLRVEPGFFTGALYISYGINMIWMFSLIGIYFAFCPWLSELWLVAAMALVVTVTIPLNFRYSRILMLYFFGSISYDPEYSKGGEVRNLTVDFRKLGNPEGEE